MTQQETFISIGYFGKVPTRGDFIKATDNTDLIGMVDEWLTRSMELLASDPRWKSVYDNVTPMHFVIAATRTPHAIAGHLVASRDQADRRFPFISLGSLLIPQPTEFLQYSPLVLGQLWNRLERQTNLVMQAPDASEALQQLCASDILLDLRAQTHHSTFADFLENHTMSALERLLTQDGYNLNLRQTILALGLLLLPVMASGTNRIDKSLILPLPNDLCHKYFVAAFWMHLVAPFLRKADFELALIMTRLQGNHVMVIGFDGASARTLQAIMHPHLAQGHQIGFEDTQWVENAISTDYRLERLSSYLAQPTLQLDSSLSHFKEVFLG